MPWWGVLITVVLALGVAAAAAAAYLAWHSWRTAKRIAAEMNSRFHASRPSYARKDSDSPGFGLGH